MSFPPISEFEQSLDDMLHAAYADGREDERADLIEVVQALITPGIPLVCAATLRRAIYAMEKVGARKPGQHEQD